MKINFYNRGQSLIGIIIVLVVVGLISGGLYYYFSRQIPEVPEIPERPAEEEAVKPEEELPKEEIVPEEIAPEEKIEEKPAEKPIIQKCADGTLYGQCSTNKPKYCENGNLVDKASLCGCPSGYKVVENQCAEISTKSAELPTVIFDDGSFWNTRLNVPDEVKVSKFFYQKYADVYDFLLIFTTVPNSLLGKLGYHIRVKNDVWGINIPISDSTKGYGSEGKLLGITFNRSVDDIPDNIGDVTVDNLNINAADTYTLIFHELLHQWAVFIGCANNENCALPVQNPYLYHWGAGLYSPYEEGSPLSGANHKWIDNGDGTFTSNRYKLCDYKYHFPRLHPIEFYLMGLKSASEIPEEYFVVKPLDDYSKAFYFYCDKPTTVRGTKVTFSVQDIINEYGERTPNYLNSQKNFSLAIILVENQNYPATQIMKDKLSSIARNAPAIWNWLTEGRSTISFPHK